MANNPVFPDEISGINSGQASFQFKGVFQGNPVTWQCTVQTLDHHYQSLIDLQKISKKGTVTLRKFIDIQNDNPETPRINIGLDVDRVDEPTIRKTIIMIHNYKNLEPGLHEYGSTYHYPGKP